MQMRNPNYDEVAEQLKEIINNYSKNKEYINQRYSKQEAIDALREKYEIIDLMSEQLTTPILQETGNAVSVL